MPVSQGVMQKSFISAIDFLDQREIDPKIYDQAADRQFTDIMRVTGRYKASSMYFYNNFENNDVWENSTISSVTSGNGTGLVVFVVNTGTGFPRIGDLIQTNNVNNYGKQARIEGVTRTSAAATITAREVNNAGFFVSVNDVVTYGSNAYPEKSGAPVSRRYGLTRYFNNIQIFRESDDITDVQKVAGIEVEVNGDYHILPYQVIQKYVYMQGSISSQFITGVKSATLFNDASPQLADTSGLYGVQTSGGLDWYTRTYGVADQAATLGTFTFTDLDDIISNWLANKAPKQQMGYMSSKTKALLDKFFKNLGSANVSSVRLVLDGNEANFEVDRVKYGNFELDFVPLNIMDHPQLIGSLPDIAGSIYWVPKDQIQVVGGGQEPRIQIRYVASPFEGTTVNGSSNGVIKEWRTGALANTPTSSEALLHTDWYTAQGLECLGVKHFQKYRVLA